METLPKRFWVGGVVGLNDLAGAGRPTQANPWRKGDGEVSSDGSENPSTGEAGPPPRRAGEDLGRVYINPHQYFADVPKRAWDFHIGGYQPAQKWLKDRKGRALSWDDIGHYQTIVKILIETDRIMGEIELPLEIQTGGEA